MTNEENASKVNPASWAHLSGDSLEVALNASAACAVFRQKLASIYEERNQKIRLAAEHLTQKDLCRITGMSPERIRQITMNYPTSWKKPAREEKN